RAACDAPPVGTRPATHASAPDGPACAADHPPKFGNGILKCDMPSVQTRNSVCLPVLTLNPLNIDTCRIPNSPPEVPAVSDSFAEFVGTDLVTPHDTPVRITNNIARDSFRVTFHDFKFPEANLLINVTALPHNGVKCPTAS